MGRAELAAIESGSSGKASGDRFFRLGMMYSTGADMPADYVTASSPKAWRKPGGVVTRPSS